MAETLADVLRAAIGAAGYGTYADAAADIGVSPGTLSKWLSGDPPNVDNAALIAGFVGRPIQEVLPLIADARLSRRRATELPRLDGQATEAQMLATVEELLTRHGFLVTRGPRSVHVDLVAERETETLGVEVKRLGHAKNHAGRMRDAIAQAVLFGRWAERAGRDYKLAIVVDQPVADDMWSDALASVGAVLVHVDDPDALLNVPSRNRLMHGNVVPLGVRGTRAIDPAANETMTSSAAHHGDPNAPLPKPTLRPAPDPEPDETP